MISGEFHRGIILLKAMHWNHFVKAYHWKQSMERIPSKVFQRPAREVDVTNRDDLKFVSKHSKPLEFAIARN